MQHLLKLIYLEIVRASRMMVAIWEAGPIWTCLEMEEVLLQLLSYQMTLLNLKWQKS